MTGSPGYQTGVRRERKEVSHPAAGVMDSAAAFDLTRSMETTSVTLDMNSFNDTVHLMAQHNCTLGATSFQHNIQPIETAIVSGTHFFDPALVNIIAEARAREFEELDDIHIGIGRVSK